MTSELLSFVDILVGQLEARSLTDDSISLDDERKVLDLLMRAHLDHEDPKVRMDRMAAMQVMILTSAPSQGHPYMNKLRAALISSVSEATSQGKTLLSLDEPSPESVTAVLSSLLPFDDENLAATSTMKHLAAELAAQVSSLSTLSAAEQDSLLGLGKGPGRRMRGSDGFIATRPSDGITASEIFSPLGGVGDVAGGSAGWAAVLDDLDDDYDDEGGGLVDLISDKRLSVGFGEDVAGPFARKSLGLGQEHGQAVDVEALASDEDGGSTVFGGLGLDVEALVKQLEAPSTRLLALKKMSGSNVYPDDLCFAPCWERLFIALSSCILEASPDPSNGSKRKSPDPLGEEGRLALVLVERLADECLTSSPLHTAALLSSLQEPMMASFFSSLPSGKGPSGKGPSGKGPSGEEALGGSLLDQIESNFPVGSFFAHLAHDLLSSCSSNWHLLKSSVQMKVAGFLYTTFSQSLDSVHGSSSWSLGIALVAIDPKLKWWRRLVSCGGPGCSLMYHQAFESGLTTRLIAFLSSSSYDDQDDKDEIWRQRMDLACLCGVTLASSAASISDSSEASWRGEVISSLCRMLCKNSQGHQPVWIDLLAALASSQPIRFQGTPSEQLITFHHDYSSVNDPGPVTMIVQALSESCAGANILLQSSSPLSSDEQVRNLSMANWTIKALNLLKICSSDELHSQLSSAGLVQISCFSFSRALGLSDLDLNAEIVALLATCEELVMQHGGLKALDDFFGDLILSFLSGGRPAASLSLEVTPHLTRNAAKRALHLLGGDIELEAGRGLLLATSTMACSISSLKALAEAGLPSLLSSWLDAAACPDKGPLSIVPPVCRFEALQFSAADHPPLGLVPTFHLLKSVLSWKGMALTLADSEGGKGFLEKVVTWLDLTNQSNSVSDASVNCLLALRCLLVWVDDNDAMEALDRRTNVRWYLKQVADSCGQVIDEISQAAGLLLKSLPSNSI